MLDKDAFAIEKLRITVITLILHNKTCVKDLSVTQKQKNENSKWVVHEVSTNKSRDKLFEESILR